MSPLTTLIQHKNMKGSVGRSSQCNKVRKEKAYRSKRKREKERYKLLRWDAVSLLESIAPGEYSSRGHRWSINSLCFRKPEAIKEKGGGSCG